MGGGAAADGTSQIHDLKGEGKGPGLAPLEVGLLGRTPTPSFAHHSILTPQALRQATALRLIKFWTECSPGGTRWPEVFLEKAGLPLNLEREGNVHF